jgi:hypothetical protein
MVGHLQTKLFEGDRVKEFKVALAAFLVLFFLIVFTIGASFLFRGESFQNACEEVQDNNGKLVAYFEESEERSLKRIAKEVEEGKNPISTIEEIRESYTPLIRTFKPVKC